MPRYDAWSVGWLHRQLDAEVDIYNSLKDHEDIPTPNLLYYRRCEQQLESRIELPKDISGRQLMIFEMAEGENSVWVGLGDHQKVKALSYQPKSAITYSKPEISYDTRHPSSPKQLKSARHLQTRP